MEAGNRDDDDFGLGRLINNAVRETDHLAPTDIPSEGMPSQRKFFYSLDCCPSFFSELGAEIGALEVVVIDRDSQLATGRQ